VKKILHITNWYPNPWHSLEGVFVRDQYRVYRELSEGKLLNVQVRESPRLFACKRIAYSDDEIGYYIFTRIKSTKFIELLTTCLLLWVFVKESANAYRVINFHIAYPLLIHFRWWKFFVTPKIIISEHWSAYHQNFHLPKNSPKLDGIKNIFRHRLPVIAVSTSLLEDIRDFSGTSDFRGYVVPNYIDLDTFFFRTSTTESSAPRFFMVNIWRTIKNPFPLLDAFENLGRMGQDFILSIGGFGPLMDKMKPYADKSGLTGRIEFLGEMSKQDIARQLSVSDAYLYSSQYETFSIACAQALCSGVPLIGPPIPAIQEYTAKEDMIVVVENTLSGWTTALLKFMQEGSAFDHKRISVKYHEYFSPVRLQSCYNAIIKEILQEPHDA